jgi:hypothetical protein
MKLVGFVIASVLALPTLARADEVLHPPGGPVYTHADHQPRPERRMKAKRLRRALIEHFDRNGDGRLGPRERMRAARVLGRIQRKLAMQPQIKRKLMQRYDVNRDGNIDRSEMPPGAARKLRRFDRDRDGWVEPGEP